MQIAIYNLSDPAPQRVIAWRDTTVFKYADLAPSKAAIAVSAATWAARLSAHYVVENGQVLQAAAAAPTHASQSQSILSAGLLITSAKNPALNGTYSANQDHLAALSMVAAYINTNGKLPGSSGKILIHDKSKLPHVVSNPDDFGAIYRALCDFSADCAIAAAQGSALPSSAVEI